MFECFRNESTELIEPPHEPGRGRAPIVSRNKSRFLAGGFRAGRESVHLTKAEPQIAVGAPPLKLRVGRKLYCTSVCRLKPGSPTTQHAQSALADSANNTVVSAERQRGVLKVSAVSDCRLQRRRISA
jgi:hypothetical protein